MEKILFRIDNLVENSEHESLYKENLEKHFIIELIKSLPHDKLKELVSFREEIDSNPLRKRFIAEIII